MSRIKEITPTDLSRLMEQADHFNLVDIRTPAEVERGVIPTATVLAMNQIPLNLDFFSISRKQIVIYCRTGSRSAQVCRFLNQQGINNVINLRGGLVKWVSNGFPLDAEPLATIA
jgi:rhodanese-related sulfurtransferase